MKRVKRIIGLLLCLMLILGAASALAGSLRITESADALEDASQFPFLAETDELAVNVRADTNTKSAKVGRLERGTQLTVLSAKLNASGEVWYEVELKDGTIGYIRSDLLVRSAVQDMAVMAARNDLASSKSAGTSAIASFRAKTTQASVNVRKDASTKSDRAGKVNRGEILTVLSQVVNNAHETWYVVRLEDGTQGYIRSDLLIEVDEAEEKRASYSGTQKKTSSQKSESKSSSGSYIGNKKTKKFHRTSCRTLPKEGNRVNFSSRDKAISKGYVPCKNCDP